MSFKKMTHQWTTVQSADLYFVLEIYRFRSRAWELRDLWIKKDKKEKKGFQIHETAISLRHVTTGVENCLLARIAPSIAP